MTQGSRLRMVDARMGSAEFLAPLLRISPHSRLPPLMTISSIPYCLAGPTQDYNPLDSRLVLDGLNARISTDLFCRLPDRGILPLAQFHDQ